MVAASFCLLTDSTYIQVQSVLSGLCSSYFHSCCLFPIYILSCIRLPSHKNSALLLKVHSFSCTCFWKRNGSWRLRKLSSRHLPMNNPLHLHEFSDMHLLCSVCNSCSLCTAYSGFVVISGHNHTTSLCYQCCTKFFGYI